MATNSESQWWIPPRRFAEVMKTGSESFRKFVGALGAVKEGYVKDVCDINPPRRIDGRLEL